MKHGIWINSDSGMTFDFEGRELRAFAGDSLSSALWRNGVKTISRSFKYHRRRGILSLSGDDGNVLLDVGDSPNVNGDLAAVKAGMIVRARHHWGGLEKDRLAAMQYLSRFLPPGFYYHAFYRPAGAWRWWEPVIRRLAGLGVVNTAAAERQADKVNAQCDVAVIGAGPAGINAARTAAKNGATVVVLDKNPQPGGSANWLPHNGIDLSLPPEVTVHCDCRATGIFADRLILAVTNQSQVGGGGLLRLHAGKIIIATGARDIPCVFPGNDLPGVMLTQAALRLACLYDVAAGTVAVMLASSEADAVAARFLRGYGIQIAAVFALTGQDEKWAQALAADGFNVLAPPDTLSAIGGVAVSAVRANAGGRRHSFDCDCVLMSGGRVPKAELAAAAGLPFPYDDEYRLPRGVGGDGLILAGAVNARRSLVAASDDGSAAATDDEERPAADCSPLPDNVVFAGTSGGKAFIDFDEDLQPGDLNAGIADGFDDIQLLKRYTTAGMGPAQGKLTNILVARQLAESLHVPVAAVGAVTARPPAAAETFAQLAGTGCHPVKLSSIHLQHRHLSAQMMNAGEWLRPALYTGAEDESQSLRTAAGVIDVSTLGKLLVQGPDAAELLERLYAGKFAGQKPGMVRYALMLDDNGVVTDDGVAARLAEDTFWVTTTTGNASVIYRNMLLWRARWKLRAEVINMTSAYAAINIAGPYAQEMMSALYPEANWELGYMRAAQVTLGGVEAIILRVGFVGEKGYEIHLPAGYLPALWSALEQVDTPAVIQPCGVEAQRLLRLEKGHIIVGQDTDGLTTPDEAAMEWAVAMSKPFFIGKRAMMLRRRQPLARRLAGFTTAVEWRHRLRESDLIMYKGEIAGRVTSVSYSPTLRKVIGLAFVPPAMSVGDELIIRTDNGLLLHGRVAETPFYDPAGDRSR